MAFLFSRIRSGKKHYFIAWFDLSKGKSNAGRCDVSCKKFGASNGEKRKDLLNFYQDKENKIAFEVENNLFKTISEDVSISSLVRKYLDDMNNRVILRKEAQGKAGISKSYYWWLEKAVTHFQNFLNEHKIKKVSEIKVNVLSDFRKRLELMQKECSVVTVNNHLRYTKRFLNDFRFTDPPVFEKLDLLCSVLKNFPVNQIMPFHFEIDELSEILIKAREFDAETCKITRESKNAGKSFKGEMPAKNVPIMPMILLIMLTGMRKSDA